MTPNELRKRFPNASAAFLQRNTQVDLPGLAGLRPSVEEPDQGIALERPVSGKASGRSRFEILFRVFARRPPDWDNAHIKELQDTLVRIGLLPDDDWKTLQGKVQTFKVSCAEEERTEIFIVELPK